MRWCSLALLAHCAIIVAMLPVLGGIRTSTVNHFRRMLEPKTVWVKLISFLDSSLNAFWLVEFAYSIWKENFECTQCLPHSPSGTSWSANRFCSSDQYSDCSEDNVQYRLCAMILIRYAFQNSKIFRSKRFNHVSNPNSRLQIRQITDCWPVISVFNLLLPKQQRRSISGLSMIQKSPKQCHHCRPIAASVRHLSPC